MKLFWTETALADLESIYSFRETKTASNIVSSILTDSDILINQPYAAPVEPLFSDIEKTIRSLVVAKGRYKIAYFIEEEYIIIARIWDCRQDTQRMKG